MTDMKKLLKLENVKVKEGVADWIEAVHHGLQPLVDQGYCKEKYMDEVIRQTRYKGPRYVSCDELALIHGSESESVVEPQVAVTVLKEPVQVKENGAKVRVLVAMAAGEENHQQALEKIADRFKEKDQLQKLLSTISTEEIYQVLVNE